MTYTHITMDELVLIEAYYKIGTVVTVIAKSLKRSRESTYKVIRALNSEITVPQYYKSYKQNTMLL